MPKKFKKCMSQSGSTKATIVPKAGVYIRVCKKPNGKWTHGETHHTKSGKKKKANATHRARSSTSTFRK